MLRLALTCLACATYGASEAGASNSLAALARLMVESDAIAAFNPCGAHLSFFGARHVNSPLVVAKTQRYFDLAGPSAWQQRNADLQPVASELEARHGQRIPAAPWQRAAPVLAKANAGAVLERQTAPPAPPPPAGGDGGDDGDDEDDDLVLRMVDPPEQAPLVEDWITRTRIYRMSGTFGSPEVAEKHSKALEVLEELRNFDVTQNVSAGQGRMLLGMATKGKLDRIIALASAEFSEETGLVVSDIAVAPVYLHTPHSAVQFSMLASLGILTQQMNTSLVVRGVTDVPLEEQEEEVEMVEEEEEEAAEASDDSDEDLDFYLDNMDFEEDEDKPEDMYVPAFNFEDDQQTK